MSKKWGIVLILVLLIGLLPAVVSGEEEPVDGGEKPAPLSLTGVIEITLQNHPGLKIAEYALNDARVELKKLRVQGVENVSRDELRAKEEALAGAEDNVTRTRMELAFEAERSYYQLLKSMQALESKKRSLEWIDRELQIAAVKFDNGLVSKNSLELLSRKKETAQEELEEAEFNLETDRMELNLAMGRGLEENFVLKESEIPYKPAELNLEEAVNYGLEHNLDIIEAQKSLMEAEKGLALQKGIEAAPVEIVRAEQAVDKARIELKKAEDELVISAREGYIGLISSRNQVENCRWDFQAAERDLEVLQLKHKEGLIPLMEMIEGYNQLAEAENFWIQSVFNYNLARAGFNRQIGRQYSLTAESRPERVPAGDE